MSPELKQFHRDIQKWVENGFEAPIGCRFYKTFGLCNNFGAWLADHGINTNEDVVRLLLEQQELFRKAGLHISFPFSGGRSVSEAHTLYAQEQIAGTVFENSARLAWIKEHAA